MVQMGEKFDFDKLEQITSPKFIKEVKFYIETGNYTVKNFNIHQGTGTLLLRLYAETKSKNSFFMDAFYNSVGDYCMINCINTFEIEGLGFKVTQK
ncbi:hypothetical protein [Paenisporosarcina sp. NPDC076898]|uniref:hypothetical protein n=1 Tax=unclassified Paenisporosarcina TaxID=2642018 RepID=UPI003D04AFF4